MQIEYEISEQDFLDGLKLAHKKLPSRTGRYLLRILPFWGLFIFLGVTWPMFQRGFTWKFETVLPFSFALLALSSPWLVKRAYRKAYRKNAAFGGRRILSFDDDGLSITGPAFSSQIRWEMFTGLAEDHKAFVLYQSNQVSQFVPKRELTQEQITELRETFTRKVAAKSRAIG